MIDSIKNRNNNQLTLTELSWGELRLMPVTTHLVMMTVAGGSVLIGEKLRLEKKNSC